jgi:hypothetical protein
MKLDDNLLESTTELERFEINRRIDMCRDIKIRSADLISALKIVDEKIAKEKDNANKDLLFGVVLFVIWAALITFVGDARQWGYVIIGLLAFFGIYRQIIKQGLTAKHDMYYEKLCDMAMLWSANGGSNFWSIRKVVKIESQTGGDEDGKVKDWWEGQVANIVQSVCGVTRGKSLIAQSKKANESHLSESLKRVNKIIESLDAE